MSLQWGQLNLLLSTDGVPFELESLNDFPPHPPNFVYSRVLIENGVQCRFDLSTRTSESQALIAQIRINGTKLEPLLFLSKSTYDEYSDGGRKIIEVGRRNADSKLRPRFAPLYAKGRVTASVCRVLLQRTPPLPPNENLLARFLPGDPGNSIPSSGAESWKLPTESQTTLRVITYVDPVRKPMANFVIDYGTYRPPPRTLSHDFLPPSLSFPPRTNLKRTASPDDPEIPISKRPATDAAVAASRDIEDEVRKANRTAKRRAHKLRRRAERQQALEDANPSQPSQVNTTVLRPAKSDIITDPPAPKRSSTNTLSLPLVSHTLVKADLVERTYLPESAQRIKTEPWDPDIDARLLSSDLLRLPACSWSSRSHIKLEEVVSADGAFELGQQFWLAEFP
ncbi:hypothetical protein OF83DRAFT_1148010 [Amylostereum chailletii]|nr:hypothetical protein OF83DRAFT_1148010 [Amylostereum chailletii]